MPIKLPSSSRFKLTDPVITGDGHETFGLLKKFDFLEDDQNYVTITVNANNAHKPDVIAANYYGSPEFFWIVILYNKPRNPFQWPNIGDVVRLPLKTLVIPAL